MDAVIACLLMVVSALVVCMWAYSDLLDRYYDLEAQHRRLEASVSAAARLMFRQRRRIQQLTADKAELERHLAISHTVCDTLAVDLAEALHIGESTPPHDAVVVDLFAKQLEQPSERWPFVELGGDTNG